MPSATHNTLHEYTRSITWGWQLYPNRGDGDGVLGRYHPSPSPGTFLDAQGIGVNVLSITATAP